MSQMKMLKIGRNADNDIVIASDQVSRYHADLILDENGQYSITDHSTNGTMVNGNLLQKTSCYISPGASVFFPGYRPLDWNLVQALMGTPQRGGVIVDDRPVRGGGIDPGMSFGETLAYFFDHYTDFSGRARRREYWFMALWNLIFMIPFPLYPIWLLVTFIPSLALTVRRLHDQGMSGWFCLLSLIPGIGGLILLIFMCMDSDPGSNQWGPSPKYRKQ